MLNKNNKLHVYLGLCLLLAGMGLSGLGNTSYGQSSTRYYTSNEQKLIPGEGIQRIVPLKSVLEKIERSHNISFLYDIGLVAHKFVSVSEVQSDSLAQFLGELLLEEGLTYKKQTDRTYVIMKKEPSPSVVMLQELVQGNVTDAETGEPLPGVNVVVKGTTTGTATDADGAYSLNVPSLQDTLVFSFIGYQTQEVPVNGRTQIDVAMSLKTLAGEELVVVGYGTKERAKLTGSVSTVSISEAKAGQPLTNVSNALHGTPGLFVSLRNSMPGVDRSTIRIRGLGTLNNSSPLVLVDGIEYSMDELNPSDIETITVLKDASAAIYGSRAANGVILVTTKDGGMESKVDYSNYVGIQRPTMMPDVIWNSMEYIELKNQAVINSGKSAEYSDEDIEEYRNGIGTNPYLYPSNNWFDLALEDGFVQKHDLSFSGGAEDYSYRLSVGYLDRNGIIIGSNNDEDKYSLSLNTTAQVTDRLEAGLSLSGYYRKYTQPSYSNGSFWNYLMRTLPIMPDTLATGEYAYTWLRTNGRNNWEHPRMIAQEGTYRKHIQRFLANVYMDYELPFNLRYYVKFGADKYDGLQERFIPQMYKLQAKTGQRYNWNSPSTAPRSYNYDWNDLNIHFYNTINWVQTFAEHHDVDLMVGASYDNFYNVYFDAAMTGYFNDNHPIPALDVGTERYSIGGSTSRDVLQSYFGRFSYEFDNKYLLDATFRYDGSSRFAPGNRWGFFPSVAAAWRISEESFFPADGIINTAKLRASVGELGNQAVALYSYEPSIQVGETYTFGGQLVSGAAVRAYTDPNITWERTRTYNVGLDMTFWEDRINFTADVYKKHTTGILRTVNIPSQIGNLSGPKQNVGSVDNSGFELIAGFADSKGDWFYSMQGNFSYNKNEVIDLNGQILYGDGTNLSTITQEGYVMNAYYLLESDGIFQTQQEVDDHAFQDNNTAPGYIRYKDQNGDGIINGDDRVTFNTSARTPKYTYGFNINVGYKGLSLDAFFQGIAGIKIYPAYNLAFPFNNGAGATREWLTDSWTPERTDARLPIVTESTSKQGNFRDSDFWLRDGSYLRLKNIQLSYALPQRWLSAVNISRLTVFVNTQNWLTFSKYDDFDPETVTNASTPYHYPMLRTLSTGLNITF